MWDRLDASMLSEAATAKIESLQKQRDEIDKQMSEIILSESPFKPGDIIVSARSGGDHGHKVVKVSTNYSGGWQYYCHVIDEKGGVIGEAVISPRDSVILLKNRRIKKK